MLLRGTMGREQWADRLVISTSEVLLAKFSPSPSLFLLPVSSQHSLTETPACNLLLQGSF
jgi:hypothetical protein